MAYPNPNSAPYSNTLALALTLALTLTRCVAYEYSGYVDDEYVRVSSGGCHHDPCETADSRGCFYGYGWDVTGVHADEDEKGEQDDDDDDSDGNGDGDSTGGDGDGDDDNAFGTTAKKEGKDKSKGDKSKGKGKGDSNVLANGYCCRGALCNLKPVEEICGAAAPVATRTPTLAL